MVKEVSSLFSLGKKTRRLGLFNALEVVLYDDASAGTQRFLIRF